MHEAPKLVKKEELLNLLLMHIPLKDCAERIHISYHTVRKYASEPEFLDSLRNLSQSVYAEVIETLKCEKKTLQQRMLEASDRALERLEELVHSQQEGISLKACDSILDRNSETARNKRIEGDVHSRFTIDPVTLMHAALTARELGTGQHGSNELPSGIERDGSHSTDGEVNETP
jgi:DNA-binding transcriptional MerR regulator